MYILYGLINKGSGAYAAESAAKGAALGVKFENADDAGASGGYTRLRARLRDSDAVSPVIAVILMVAITVVLASVLYVWAMGFIDPNAGKTEAVACSLNTASYGDWTVSVISTTSAIQMSDTSFVVTTQSGIEVVRNAASENTTPSTFSRQKAYAYTTAVNMSGSITPSGDLGTLSNVSFLFLDSNGDGLIGVGDTIRIYDDIDGDGVADVQSGYVFKIVARDGTELYKKTLP